MHCITYFVVKILLDTYTGLPGVASLIIAKGLAASPGAAVGELCFNNNAAKELSQKGRSVILVRVQTSADDVVGMHAAAGILTMRGGMTSHAAVVARGIAKPAVVGCGDYLLVDEDKEKVIINIAVIIMIIITTVIHYY